MDRGALCKLHCGCRALFPATHPFMLAVADALSPWPPSNAAIGGLDAAFKALSVAERFQVLGAFSCAVLGEAVELAGSRPAGRA